MAAPLLSWWQNSTVCRLWNFVRCSVLMRICSGTVSSLCEPLSVSRFSRSTLDKDLRAELPPRRSPHWQHLLLCNLFYRENAVLLQHLERLIPEFYFLFIFCSDPFLFLPLPATSFIPLYVLDIYTKVALHPPAKVSCDLVVDFFCLSSVQLVHISARFPSLFPPATGAGQR